MSAGSDAGRGLLERGDTGSALLGTDGLSACLSGQLGIRTERADELAISVSVSGTGGLRSIVIAPLVAENTLFGALLVGRRRAEAFGSTDCEFLNSSASTSRSRHARRS